MKILFKVLLFLLLLLVVIVAGLALAMHFHDGPNGVISGGPFTTGEHYSGTEPDWSFVHDIQEVQFQLLDPSRSRTTWIIEVDGRVFIPCGYMDTIWGRLWKQWPVEAEEDGRIVLRIDGILYERELVRLMQGPILEPVLTEMARKYVGGVVPEEMVISGSLWLFEIKPRQNR